MKKRVILAMLIALCLGSLPVKTVFAAGSDSTGYSVTNADSSSTSPFILNSNNIATIDTSKHGLEAKSGGVIQMTGGTIATGGFQAFGAHITGDNSSITMTDVGIKTGGVEAMGIQVGTNGKVSMSGGSITTNGNTSRGVFVSGGSALLNGVTLTTTGVSAIGINATGSGSEIVMNGGSITTYNSDDRNGTNNTDGASGATASYSATISLTDVDISSNGNTLTNKNASHGVYALRAGTVNVMRGSIITKGARSHGAYSNGDGSEVILAYTSITTSGDGAFGLYSYGAGAHLQATGTKVVTSGDSTYAAIASSSSTMFLRDVEIEAAGKNSVALYAGDGGLVTLKGAVISADNTKNTETILVKGSSGAVSKIYAQEAVYNINGLVKAANYGNIDMTMGDGSTFTGFTDMGTTQAAIDMKIYGSSSRWNVSQDSVLTNLTLDGSTVNFVPSPEFSTLTTKDLNGSGIFIMKSDIVNQQADNLIVTGTTSGSHLISVINNGSAVTTGDEITRLVKTADTNGNFALVNDAVELGAWKYRLRQNTTYGGDGAEWELYGVGELSDPADDASGTFMGSYMLAYAETTFIQRMGDLRSSPHLAGLWARSYGGQFENKPANGSNHFDMDVFGINIGYDRKLEIGWKGDVYVGGFFGYSQGDIDYNNGGSGTIESQMIGLYASFVSPGGFYADSVLKYRWRSSDFDTYDSAGDHITSNKIHTAGFGWSLELGQRISFNGTPKNGWYMEPQVQLRHQRHDDGYYTLSNGLRIGTDGFTSIIGRVGALIGYESPDRNFYVKVFRAKEFDGELNVYANGDRIEHSIGGSWWIYGLGYTTKLSDRNSLYLDLERTSGADFEQKWRLNLGWRMEF